jgi:hypothetical protein
MNRGIVVILVVFCIFFIVKTFIDYDDTYYVKSRVDSKEYLIRNKYKPNSEIEEETVDTLALIYKNVSKLIVAMKEKDVKPYWLKYLDNFQPSSISEAAIEKKYTTYTVDKKHIHICLRTRDSEKKIYDMNDLLYVVIHELAHMVNYTRDGKPIMGHTLDFQLKFKYLINEAIEAGIYKYYDYSKQPKDYCGMQITSHILN